MADEGFRRDSGNLDSPGNRQHITSKDYVAAVGTLFKWVMKRPGVPVEEFSVKQTLARERRELVEMLGPDLDLNVVYAGASYNTAVYNTSAHRAATREDELMFWSMTQPLTILSLALIEHGCTSSRHMTPIFLRRYEDGVRKRHMLALWAAPLKPPEEAKKLEVLKALERPAVAEVWELIGGDVLP